MRARPASVTRAPWTLQQRVPTPVLAVWSCSQRRSPRPQHLWSRSFSGTHLSTANKRTALKSDALLLFLARYEPTPSPRELRDITLEVAEHRLGVDGSARWLEEHSQPKLKA